MTTHTVRIDQEQGSIEQPLPDDQTLWPAYIARLAPLVPLAATWQIIPYRALHGPKAPVQKPGPS